MALYEFYCERCDHRFEQLTSSDQIDLGQCPKCKSAERTRRQISAFRVGGRGDLRESTMHGCHDCAVPLAGESGSGGGGGSSSDGGSGGGGGHSCGSGCSH